MITLTLILCGVAALVLLTWLHLGYWTRRFEPHRKYSLVERIETEDGSAIELRRVTTAEIADVDRVEPAPETAVGAAPLPPLPPVLVVHGIGIDHRNNDMFDGRSMVRALAARGRDVWLVTLRSGRTGLSFRERSRVTFARMARHDVPLAVREVLRRTGSAQVDYLGFSMGGMLLYAALALKTIDASTLRRVAILGSPGAVIPASRWISRLARVWPAALVPGVWLSVPSRMVAFLAGHLTTPIHREIIQPGELHTADIGPALATIRDIPLPLFRDFARFVRAGRVEVDGVDVLPELANVGVPAVFVAGAGDRIASPEGVRAGYDAWGSAVAAPKKWHLVSKEGGQADHGHGDLAFGHRAPTSVFPILLEHLSARD